MQKTKKYRMHGLSHTRIDNIYKGMVDRCHNPASYNYHKYGARGTTVCDEWMEDKTAFFKWAFANGYNETLTLDRIDNDKGYSPDNCRWSTYKAQANNKRNNRILEAFGQEKTMAEWADVFHISPSTIWARLKYGWDVKRAISTPVKPSCHRGLK
jgi:hypothetical protein